MENMSASGAQVIPFSRPYLTPNEISNVTAVLESDHSHGDGRFTASASKRLADLTGASKVLLTTSGTHALDLAARLLDLGPGDEVIMPSFTFSSGATSIVSTGATPVFVDVDSATGNIDPERIAAAITPATKAISVMHYGGVPVDMTAVLSIASDRGIPVIEDNAHGLGVRTKYGTLGTLGTLAIQSFHDTKNVHCGEGGALLINDESLAERAEIIREKGTNRSRFLRGQVDKYTWVDQGSSYLPSEINAAVLDSQLEHFDDIQERRFAVWNRYASELAEWASANQVTLMTPPEGVHAAHVFYLHAPTAAAQQALLAHMRGNGVIGTFHYVPLHSSPAGHKFGRTAGDLSHTDAFASRLVRVPLWTGLSASDVDRIVSTITDFRVAS
jgi:dTDP-4-amino-4,6-dideoxygalactose transaminase